jgi:putative inorganic carbon (HCO3(-)) transporter
VNPRTLEQSQRWFLRIGLFLLPLAYWWDTYDRYVLPKLLVARVLVLGLLAFYILRMVITRTFVFKKTPLDLPWLAFLASALLSTLVGENQNVAVFGIYSRYDGLVTILTYAALFWLSVQTLDGSGDGRALLRVLMASGYVAAMIAILQCITSSMALGSFVPASGTLGQKNVLGAFLVIICALAYGELVTARSWLTRILAGNVLAVSAIALYLSDSRSAWVAAAIALVIAASAVRGPGLRTAIAGVAALVLVVGTLAALNEGQRQRIGLGDAGDRPAIWRDSVQLIASRPLIGYGPDTFGMVFPRFEERQFPQQLDKAHAETLQIAATQGVLGLGAYVWLLIAFIRAFWRGRRAHEAIAVMAAWIAYTATLQVNFSAPAAAFPFWIFAAAAMEMWGATHSFTARTISHGRSVVAAASIGIAGLAAIGAAGTVLPFLADASLLQAVNADFSGRNRDAEAPAQLAARLWPRESVYAVEVANIAFEHGDWSAARAAYSDAAALGTYNALVYRNLALADRNLGLTGEARDAARKAVELDRFDPANRALLAEFHNAP